MAGLDARAAASIARAVGQVRPVVRAFGAGGISSRRAKRRSACTRGRSFRARYGSGSDRRVGPGVHEEDGGDGEGFPKGGTVRMKAMLFIGVALLIGGA